MTDQTNKGKSDKRLNDAQRFKYIGFEVFPGQPKDLFRNDNEKKQLELLVAERRAKGEILREDCTLMVERVSIGERFLLTGASLMVIAALFLPFYSVYTEIEVVTETAAAEVPAESIPADDTTLVAEAAGSTDSAGILTETSAAAAILDDTTALIANTGEAERTTADMAAPVAEGSPRRSVTVDEGGHEIITGLVVHKKYRREFSRVSGFWSLITIGSLGSYLFSSGLVLILTFVIFLVYTLACLAIPGFTLYSIYGSGAKGDALVLLMKKSLKLSWWPVALFCGAMFLSFFGADYGFSTVDTFSSIGKEYGLGVLLDSMSYGIAVSLAGFIILAAKGSEI